MSEAVGIPEAGQAAEATILVVEDDPGLQETLQAVLELEGYATRLAGDGLEALARVEEARPDLILLDLMLPRMDGFAFVEALAARRLRPAVPILVLTADGRAPEKAARIGAEGYLAKPFEVVALLDEVERCLNG